MGDAAFRRRAFAHRDRDIRMKPAINAIKRLLGPGLVTGAADDDPSGIATYSQAGAAFGYGLLWTVFLTTPFMIAIQLVSAKIGRVTGKDIVANAKDVCPRWLVTVVVVLLVAANTINIAADLAAMGEALSLVIGGLTREHALIFAAVSVLLQIFVPYRHYAPTLKLLTLVLFSYVATVFAVGIPWREVLFATFVPAPSLSYQYLLMVVAVLGTTISPLSVLLASLAGGGGNAPRPQPPAAQGIAARWRTRGQSHPDRHDLGMIYSNLIAYFIVVTTASTLNSRGITDIQSAAAAAEALRPIAGEFAFLLFALGIVGTGLLAIPVLAGSAAYGVAEAFGWPATLEAKAPDAIGFYSMIGAATIIGFALGFSPINPIQFLVWSAVLNGVVAVPIMAIMMLVVTHAGQMGRFRAGRSLAVCGWGATALMAATVIAMFGSLLP
jgi:Mn2+/Fe2+ NRAMP family transporter